MSWVTLHGFTNYHCDVSAGPAMGSTVGNGGQVVDKHPFGSTVPAYPPVASLSSSISDRPHF